MATVNDNDPRVEYTATASQTTFTRPFFLNAEADLDVYANGVLVTSGYTHTGVGANTGTLVFSSGRTVGDIIILTRSTAKARSSAYTNGQPLPASALEDDNTRSLLLEQEAGRDIGRALRIPITDTALDADDLILPAKATRASKALTFDADGIPTVTTLANGSAASNAASITYDPAGSGATARTVQAVLRDTISIKDFGAVGDGSTNNSTAIQAAITAAAAAGKALYIPGATASYRFATTLSMTTLVPIYGDGMDESVLEYTGAGVGLLIEPASVASSASHFRGHTMRDFSIKPSVDNGGTYGIHVSLASSRFYAQFLWEQIRIGVFGTYSAWLNNTIANTDGFFVGTIFGCQINNSIKGTKVGDGIYIINSRIGGSAPVLMTMIAGARKLIIDHSVVYNTAGLVFTDCNGVELRANQIELPGSNYTGSVNAEIFFGDCTAISVVSNRIGKVAGGTAPNYALVFDGTTSKAFVDENEFGTNYGAEHVIAVGTTSNITIGAHNTYEGTKDITLSGTNCVEEKRPVIQRPGNAATNIAALTTFVQLEAVLTAPRIWTFPAASEYNEGDIIAVSDIISGVSATNTLTFTSSGSTFNGAASHVVRYPNAKILLVCDGVSSFSVFESMNALTGSATFNPASLADAAGETTTVTVTGAVLGDYAEASFSLDLQGITVTAWVSAADTVSVRFQNETGGVLDLASGTLRARVRRA